jgi:hypothetical protein
MNTKLAQVPEVQSGNRLLVLKRVEGESIKNSAGITDNRLFTGQNEVRAVFEGTLWQVKYSIGDVPPVLKQKFTSFKKLLEFVEPYYRKRGLAIVDIVY